MKSQVFSLTNLKTEKGRVSDETTFRREDQKSSFRHVSFKFQLAFQM